MTAASPDTSKQTATRQKGFVTGPLALRDLMHEPLITICLIFSVVAVLAPILLLTSVKVGFIDNLRQQFIEDPSFREIRPGSADLRSQDIFDRIATWEGVDYVVPTVMMNPREVNIRARTDKGVHRDDVLLLPSNEGDPFLRELDGSPPAGDGVVLTRELFEKTGLAMGDMLTFNITRIVNDKRDKARFDLKIVGIVPSETVALPTILADPKIDQQVEAFRAGIAVPERGWKGVNAEPTPAYQRLLVVAPDGIGARLETELRVRVGAAATETPDAAQVSALVGAGELSFPDHQGLYLLQSGNRLYSRRSVEEANALLSNSTATAVGLSSPVGVEILEKTLDLTAIPEGLSLDGVPDVSSRGAGFKLNNRIALPEAFRATWTAAGEPGEITVTVVYPEGASTKKVALPMVVSGFHDGELALVSAPMLGLINRGQQIILDYDSVDRRLMERNAGFRGFRLIGGSIDDIPGLVDRMTAEGIEVRAKSAQILKLQRLEESLNLLVLVVASVALAGGLSILTASFFANVQRKRVDYATLRLIGMPKRQIALVPILQSLVVAGAGFVLSVLTYFLIAALLNGAVSEELGFDGQLSKLYFTHFVNAAIIVLVGSCLASLAAARAATQIDPATALRSGS